MRTSALVATLLLATAIAGNCTFSAHPTSGAQACSNDNPPQCPDGYTCVGNLCFDNAHLPSTGGTSGSNDDSAVAAPDAPACTPTPIVCRTGAGKRCGKVTDSCGGSNPCGDCITGEICAAKNVCVPCGQANQPCCAGSKCSATDAICSNGQCLACGGANQLCCASDVCSTTGAKCVDLAAVDAGRSCLLTCATTVGACNSDGGGDQVCTAECGPGETGSKIGSRICACTGNAWKCPTCAFPAGGNYACYKLPSPVPACNATTPPTAGTSCSVTDCSPCGSTSGKGFIDAGGTARSGYCVCTNNRWNCTVTRDWPCPGNQGC